ncbi:V-type ATPase subunit [Streptococcus halichoeri]|uniref:V-type ATPase subunit n=1 Tax=Streptococcus halichoeri TaxID=254785 RepID=UPI00135BA726|nr:V-type ATPase subunit [Streptococcus halichoeri]
MNTSRFTQVNTTISVKEKDLFTAEQFSQMLNSPDNERLGLLFQASPYQLSVNSLGQLDLVEHALMTELAKTFKWAYQESPYPELVDLFTLRYTYHNLKVLLKAKASQRDLHSLLLPIGIGSQAALKQLVSTLNSDSYPFVMVHEVQSIWAEYLDYQDSRVIEIGADLAYFKHLMTIAQSLKDGKVMQAVKIIIECYNLITVGRAQQLGKSTSFIKQLISSQGSYPIHRYQELLAGSGWNDLFDCLISNPYAHDLRNYQTKLSQGALSLPELEYLSDYLLFALFDEAKYDSDGPYLLPRYLLGKQFEVKNIRLILSALVNQLPMAHIKERMRPIYGQ